MRKGISPLPAPVSFFRCIGAHHLRPLFTRVEFDWTVAANGYTFLRGDDVSGVLLRGGDVSGLHIVPRKGPATKTKPFHQFPALFKQFATSQPTPHGALQFASKFGLLQRGDNELATWLRHRMDFAELIAPNEREPRSETKVSALKRVNSIFWTEVITEISELGGIVVKPQSLLAAMTFQLGLWFGSDDQHIGQCAKCGATLVFGTGTGHRVSRRYCSISCQAAAAYERKKKQVNAGSS
jgi:hypothetical protein